MGLIFAYREGHTFLHRANPVLKIVFLLGLSFCPWWVTLPIAAVLAIITALPVRSFLKQLVFFIVIGLLILLSNGPEAILGFLAVVLLGLVFADTTAPEDLARSLQPVLGRRFSLIVALTLTMVPLCLETMEETRLARKSRGERTICAGWITSAVSALLDRCDELSLALRCRAGMENL